MKTLSLFLLLAIVPATLAFGADRRFEKKFSVTPGGTLKLNTDVGSISIVGGDTKEVSVVADLRGALRDIDDFKIDAWQAGSDVEVKGQSTRSFWSFKFTDIEVRYTITVPREYSTEVHTSGGNITLATLKGRFRGETSGGDIMLKDIEGSVTMETSGGNIGADGVAGDLAMETSGGDIMISDTRGAVRVGTSGGNITVRNIDGKVHAETSGGNIIVRLPGANKGVFAETSGGDIDILVPKGTAATIDASTSGGDVVCDLPIMLQGRIDESRVRGNVNGGGETIRAHTSGGDVSIKSLE